MDDSALKEMLKKLEDLEDENKMLRKNVMLYEGIIEKMPFDSQIFDENGLSYKINKALKDILGIPSVKEALGKFNVLSDPYSIANGVNKIYEKVYNGEEYSHEFEYNLGLTENSTDNGKEAIRLALEKAPELVLMDIGLPDMSGYGVIRKVLNNKSSMNINAQTAFATPNDRDRALKAGCIDI